MRSPVVAAVYPNVSVVTIRCPHCHAQNALERQTCGTCSGAMPVTAMNVPLSSRQPSALVHVLVASVLIAGAIVAIDSLESALGPGALTAGAWVGVMIVSAWAIELHFSSRSWR